MGENNSKLLICIDIREVLSNTDLNDYSGAKHTSSSMFLHLKCYIYSDNYKKITWKQKPHKKNWSLFSVSSHNQNQCELFDFCVS